MNHTFHCKFYLYNFWCLHLFMEIQILLWPYPPGRDCITRNYIVNLSIPLKAGCLGNQSNAKCLNGDIYIIVSTCFSTFTFKKKIVQKVRQCEGPDIVMIKLNDNQGEIFIGTKLLTPTSKQYRFKNIMLQKNEFYNHLRLRLC